jgi:hypothetical protein
MQASFFQKILKKELILSKRFQIVRAENLPQVDAGASLPTNRRKLNRTVVVFNVLNPQRDPRQDEILSPRDEGQSQATG